MPATDVIDMAIGENGVAEVAAMNGVDIHEGVRRRAELVDLEARVDASFQEVGAALREIRDSGLYRFTLLNLHGAYTFANYVKERFGMSPQQAYRLIDSERLMELLRESNVAVMPTRESQVRELVPSLRRSSTTGVAGTSEDERAVELWNEAVSENRGSVPTARQVRAVVRERNTERNSVVAPAPERSDEALTYTFADVKNELVAVAPSVSAGLLLWQDISGTLTTRNKRALSAILSDIRDAVNEFDKQLTVTM